MLGHDLVKFHRRSFAQLAPSYYDSTEPYTLPQQGLSVTLHTLAVAALLRREECQSHLPLADASAHMPYGGSMLSAELQCSQSKQICKKHSTLTARYMCQHRTSSAASLRRDHQLISQQQSRQVRQRDAYSLAQIAEQCCVTLPSAAQCLPTLTSSSIQTGAKQNCKIDALPHHTCTTGHYSLPALSSQTHRSCPLTKHAASHIKHSAGLHQADFAHDRAGACRPRAPGPGLKTRQTPVLRPLPSQGFLSHCCTSCF
jgi:hypothetical protein